MAKKFKYNPCQYCRETGRCVTGDCLFSSANKNVKKLKKIIKAFECFYVDSLNDFYSCMEDSVKKDNVYKRIMKYFNDFKKNPLKNYKD